MPSADVIFFALFGGIIPSLFWLFFWLREDSKRPEPRGLLALTFLFGMIAVPFVVPFQRWWIELGFTSGTIPTVIVWASIEEIFKFIAAYIAALRKRDMNEPVDALIYMMTAALGFAALENAIFIFHPIAVGNVAEGLITGNVRFIGASLLHTISSATIGIAMALSFYKSKTVKAIDVFWGILVAIALHTAFNLFIMREHGGTTFATFGFVWIAIVVLMLFFEKVKRIYAVNKIE